MTWVLFDYGGVICRLQPDEDLALLAAAAGCSRQDLADAYWAYRLDYDRGDLDGTSYWRKVSGVLGRTLPDAQIKELIRLDVESWLHLHPQMVALIEDVAGAGHRLAVLSNAPAELAGAVSALPVAGHFEHLAFSCFLRSAKPDQACYRAVLGRLDARPGDVIFLDDRPENVASAGELGIRGIHVTTPAAARSALAAHGITTSTSPVRSTAPTCDIAPGSRLWPVGVEASVASQNPSGVGSKMCG